MIHDWRTARNMLILCAIGALMWVGLFRLIWSLT